MRSEAALGIVLAFGSGCAASGSSPYGYCDGKYEPLDPTTVTPLGYSAQDAIDRHGLTHTGALLWSVSDDPGYALVLPDDSSAAIELKVDRVRWATYEVNTRHRWIIVQCPIEGLEVWVSGTAELVELGLELPVQGHLLATRSDAGDVSDINDLAFGVERKLRGDEVTPFLPTLDDFAAGEDFTYDGVTATLYMSVGASGGRAHLQVTWDEGHSISDRDLPFQPELVLAAD